VNYVAEWLCSIDQAVALVLIPLAVWILVSGIDDLILNTVFVLQWVKERGARSARLPSEAELEQTPERLIAIFVPAWKEHRVIARMLEHNLAAVQYSNYHFFVGAYRNDSLTVAAIKEVEAKFPNVHLAETPHDGPTSKADCLNTIYQRLQQFESDSGLSFEILVTHDAEDLIHPASLRWINVLSRRYDMVQVPVIPLPTPVWKLVHGIYCDEFSECHTRDMRARQFFDAFIPSCGVGTGFTREILDRLAEHAGGRIFEPVCLTEDYENGLRLKNLGAKQIFVPILRRSGSFVTTREFFPQTFRTAIKQRTRWVTGIALQTWERYGWTGNLVQRYWLWRDRKGLVGNPVGLVTTLISLYGAFSFGASCVTNTSWTLAVATEPVRWLFQITLALGVLQLLIRAVCVGRCYGVFFAMFVPIRVVIANFINSAATFCALKRFLVSKLRREPLVWLKTEHAYPTQGALSTHKRSLREVLTSNGFLTEERWQMAVETKPDHLRLERHLVRSGYLSESDLYEALGIQQSLPAGPLEISEIRVDVARSLPAAFSRQWRVLPFKVDQGRLWIAAPEAPTEDLQIELKRLTQLEPRFHLVPPGNFAALASELL
jgi:bacteriophage N4 adsorption protein B